MPGLFDDLVAPAAAPPRTTGLFDDLVAPNAKPQVPLPQGAVPVPPTPAAQPGFGLIDAAAQADKADAAGGYQRIDPLTDKPVERPFEFGRTGVAALEGANRAAASMLLAPSAAGHVIGAQLAKLLGLPEPFDQPAAAYQELVNRDPVQPENVFERGAMRGGNQAMLNLPLAAAAGPFGAALTASRTMPFYEMPVLKQAATTVAETAAAKPVGFAAGDVAANIGSGLGAEIGKDNLGVAGETIGGALGGVLPAAYPKWISPTGIIARTVAKVAPGIVDAAAGMAPGVADRGLAATQYANREGIYADPSIPNPNSGSWIKEALAAAAERQSAKLQSRVAGNLGQAMATPGAQANLDEAQALRQAIPGFNPSVAKSMNSQPLLNMERTLGEKATGEDLTNLRGQSAANAAAIDAFAGGRVPPVQGAAPADQQVIDLLTRQAQAADRAAAQGPAGLENQIRDATAALPERSTIETGTQIRGATDVAERAANAEVQRLRAAIDPSGTFREPTTSLYNAIVGRLNNLGTDLTNPVIPPKVREILGNARPQAILDAQGQPAGRVAPTYDIDSLLTARQQVGQKLRQLGPVQSVEAADARAALAATRDGIDAEVARISQAPAPGPQAPQAPVLGLPAPQERISGPQAPAAAVDPMRQAGSKFATDYLARLKSVSPEDLQNLIADAEKQVVRHARTEAESQQYRQGLTDVYRKALANAQGTPAAPGGPSAPAAMPIARGAAPGAPLPPEQPSTIQSRLADYNRYYREQYVPRFRQDLGAELGATRASGQEVIKPEDIIPRLLGPNNASEMRQFNLIHGQDAGARDTVINAALDDIRRGVGPSGVIGPDDVAKWVRSHSRVLDEAPWLREAVSARDPAALYQRLGEAEAARRATADENLTSMLGKQPHEVIDAGLKDSRVMRQIAANAKAAGPDAEAALRRAVWERATGAGGGTASTLPDPAKLRQFMADNAVSLSHVLTPEHMSDLETIARAAEVEGRLPPPKGAAEAPATVSSAVEGLTGSGIPSVLNKAFAFMSGRVPKGYLSADIGLRVLNNFNEKEAARAWREALFNPDVARTIADGVRNGRATPMQQQKLKSYLLQAPGNALSDIKRRQEENQQEQP
jgi:hypothetical protein